MLITVDLPYYRLAEESREIELKAVLLIQRIWRGKLVRLQKDSLTVSAVKIQTRTRGYLARKKMENDRIERVRLQRMSVYDYNATLIQKR